MADAEATAVFKIKADAQPAIKEVIKLQKAQEGFRYEVEKGGKSFSQFIDGAAVGLAKFNLAMGGINTGLGMLKQGIDMAKEVNAMERLERALPTGAVDRLSRASQGLIDRHSQLRLGVKGLTGDFALTQTQMEKVMQAAVALEQRGFGPAAENAEKLLDALAKGVNKLDDFGINLEKTTDRQADVNEAMKKFDELIRTTPVDERAASMAQLEQAISGVVLAVKEVVASVVNGLASINQALPDGWKLGDLAKGALNVASAGAIGMSPAQQAYADLLKGQDAFSTFLGRGRGILGNIGNTRLKPNIGPRATADQIEEYEIQQLIDLGVDPTAFGWYRVGATGQDYRKKGPKTEYVRNRPGAYNGPEGLGWQANDPGMGMFGTPLAFLGLQDPSFATQVLGGTGIGRGGEFGANRLQFDQDPMARLRGKAGTAFKDFGLDVAADQIGAAASAMSSAMTAALEAAISGSEGIGKAARKASAQVLKALAVESAGRAVYEGALALGSLAIGNVAGASTHGAAAAKFAIAAAVTGAGAAALGSGTGAFQGGGGGGAGAPAGGGFTRAPTAGQGGGGGTNITINFGDGFVGDQRQVADAVAKAVQDSQRRGGSRTGAVRFDG